MGPASYTLSDLLMFSPEVYFRLFVLYNQALWPVHGIVALLTLAVVALTRRPSAAASRTVAGLMALSWAAIAWFFLQQRYAEINLAAPWFAAGFGLQAILWAGVAVAGRPRFGWAQDRDGATGLVVLVLAAVVLPLLGPLSGRPWTGIELFGLAPDPTALGSLGLLLMARGRGAGGLAIVPVLWCLVTGLTYLAMDEAVGLVTAVLGVVAAALIARRPAG